MRSSFWLPPNQPPTYIVAGKNNPPASIIMTLQEIKLSILKDVDAKFNLMPMEGRDGERLFSHALTPQTAVVFEGNAVDALQKNPETPLRIGQNQRGSYRVMLAGKGIEL